MAELFHITSVNPNDTTGGSGCVCSESKDVDCTPPYAVFPATEMNTITSPHVVICARCLRSATTALDGEVLTAGEVDPVAQTIEAGGIDAEAERWVADDEIPEL